MNASSFGRGRGWLGLVCLVASVARADTFANLGAGPRAMGMANAMTADARDATATFYNPAMLPLRADSDVMLGFTYSRTSTSVDSLDTNRVLDCSRCTPPESAGFTVGARVSLGGKLKNRVALGLLLYKPGKGVVHVLGEDPTRPFFYTYDNDQNRLGLYLGLGVRITDELSFGVGGQILADFVGRGATVQTNQLSQTVLYSDLDSSLGDHMRPTAGLSFVPDPSLRFGLSYRYEFNLAYEIPANIQLAGIGDLLFRLNGVDHYSPHIVNFGVAWDPFPELTLSGDVALAFWSGAVSPYVDVSINVTGGIVQQLGLGNALLTERKFSSPGFSNTVTPRLGVEYRVMEELALRGGAFFRPTPVPDQTSPSSNILDSSTVGVTLGAGVAFPDPLELVASPIHFDLGAQAAFLLSRTTQKQATDNTPSYTSSALNLALTASVRLVL